MATPCKACPLRRYGLFASIEASELEALQRFKSGELHVQAGTTIMMEGSNSPQLYTVLGGMGLRYKSLENGRRQVLSLIYPGDFLGLQAGIMGEMQHSVEATTAMTLCVFNRSDFWKFFRNHPERAFDMTWLAATEERFLGESLTNIGQRNAPERMSWALARMFIRARATGLARGNRCPLPYRQQDIADSLGLSLVHTNKTLARLRELNLASWSDGWLTVNDLDGLAERGGIDLSRAQVRPLI